MPKAPLITAALLACATAAPAAEPSLQAAVESCARSNTMAFAGQDRWLFLDKELKHLSDTNPPSQALETISDFKEQVDRAGAELIVVPVPCKAAIYPEKLGATGDLAAPDHAAMEALRAKGITVLDLTEDFRQARAAGLDPYCRTDTHWSPAGIALAAKKIAAQIAARPWAKDLPQSPFSSSESEIAVKGDLGGGQDSESIKALAVSPSALSRTSPVLLLGDSHNLVFSAGGDMHATNAGLPDLLALELKSPVDAVAVRGSGATPARRNLARRKDNLAGKKLVIWCFAARELTQSSWEKVPVVK